MVAKVLKGQVKMNTKDDYDKLAPSVQNMVDNLLSNQATGVKVYIAGKNEFGKKQLRVEWFENGKECRTLVPHRANRHA